MHTTVKSTLNQNLYLFLEHDDGKQDIFNNRISPDVFSEAERFRILASSACPWSHLVLMVIKLKKLDGMISISYANPILDDRGWTFGSGHDLDYLDDVYRGVNSQFKGQITLPLLWDNRDQKIINNSSYAISEILDQYSNPETKLRFTLFPKELLPEIQSLNEMLKFNLYLPFFQAINSRQSLYEKACEIIFDCLHFLDDFLSRKKFMLDDRISIIDLKLFSFLVRFDVAFYYLFHINLKRLKDFSNLFDYVKCIYQIDGISSTCNFTEIKAHYFKSRLYNNSHRIIPIGPVNELNSPHSRGWVQFFDL